MNERKLKNQKNESIEEEKKGEVKNEENLTIGDFFRAERVKKGISLDKISRDTRINLTMLENLESNSFEKLPNKAYVTGYIKSYAKVLGIDQEKSLDIWRSYCLRLHGEGTANRPLKPIPSLKVTLPDKVERNLADGPEVTAKVKEKIKEKDVEKVEKIVEVGQINKKEEISDDVAEEKTDKKISFRAMPVGTYKVLSNLGEEKKHLPQKIQQATISGLQNLFINAVDGETWLTYKKDKDRPRKIFLKKGGTLFVQGKDIRIFFGNIAVTKLFLNGKSVNIETDRRVRSLVFPIENVKKFKLPLFVYLDNGKVVTSDDYLSKLDRNVDERRNVN